MNLKSKEFLNNVLNVAHDAIQNDFKMGSIPIPLKEAIEKNPVASTQFVVRYSATLVMSCVINYHQALRDELLKQGIDIGRLFDDVPPDEPSGQGQDQK